MIKIKNNFDLKSTITCGQIFRFIVENDNSYTIVIKDRVINLKEDNDYIIVESSKEEDLKEIIYDYFDLNRDYDLIEKNILKCDKKLENALKFSRGLKMIHQDPFETLIAYIISQNNRVQSIANALNLLSYNYGKKVIFKGKEYYLFPSIEKLKELSILDFRNCKVGFRDKYLYQIMRDIENNNLDLEEIYNMNSEDSLKYLISFKGIGNKVASCILLFAYQKFDVYPIDTWVKKFMKEDYNIEGEQNIRRFTYETYKEYSGLAIQYMFNYKRNKK
ncbi:MAG: DNA-3-methyladenine glycosylase 2 family protein [Bacilli bacterium]|nr:DNA-3-methyladenine glycosylase 2 family protein [Bacilli bacterium]